jgi:hypothetical protein
MINFPFVLLREGHNPLKYKITSVAHPLFVAECVQGLPSPPQLVQATISFGPLCSRRFSPCNDTRRAIWQEERERKKKVFHYYQTTRQKENAIAREKSGLSHWGAFHSTLWRNIE